MVRGPRTAMKSGPHLPQLEKALAQKRRPNTAKRNKLIKKNGCNGKFYIMCILPQLKKKKRERDQVNILADCILQKWPQHSFQDSMLFQNLPPHPQ